MRICSVFGCTRKHSAKGLCRRHTYLANRDKALADAAAYYAANKATILPKQAAYKAANADKIAARNALYNAAHPNRAYGSKGRENREQRAARYQANKTKVLAQVAAYEAANPDVTRAKHQRRRAKKANAPGGNATPTQLRDLWTYHIGRCCYWCLGDLGEYENRKNRWADDHIIALAIGGSDDIENHCFACVSCNSSKWKRVPYLDWIPPKDADEWEMIDGKAVKIAWDDEADA